MYFDTELDQFLWDNDCGFRVQVGTPRKGETVNVFRLDSDIYGSVILNTLPKDGIYTLEETGSKDCDKNHLFTLGSVCDYKTIAVRLKLLNTQPPKIPEIHAVNIDVESLSKEQYKVLSQLLKRPEAMTGDIKIQSTRYIEGKFTRATVEEFNSKFYANRTFEQTSDIVMFIATGETFGKIYNLSKLYSDEVIDLDIIYNYLVKVASENKFNSILNNPCIDTRPKIVDKSVNVSRMETSETNKRIHLLETLSRHNPNVIIHGEGSDYINYEIDEKVVKLPFTLKFKEGLWIATLPLVENGFTYSPRRTNAIRLLTDKINSDSTIKPYTMDLIHAIKNYRFSNPNEFVHEAEFKVLINTGKRKSHGNSHQSNKQYRRKPYNG